jgi:tetratricopeptide (TPR) repeat protein
MLFGDAMRYTILLLSVLTLMMVNNCGTSEDIDPLSQRSELDLINSAKVYYEMGEYDRAWQYYNAVFTFYPDTDYYVDVNIGKAQILGKQEKFEEQLAIMLQTLKSNIMPQFVPRIYTEIGHFYAKFAPYDVSVNENDINKNYLRAIDYYSKAIDYDESNDWYAKAEAQSNLGLTFAILNEWEKASNNYQEVLAKYPDSPFTISVRSKLNNVTDISPIKIIFPDKMDDDSVDEEVTVDTVLEDEIINDIPIEPQEDQTPADSLQ